MPPVQAPKGVRRWTINLPAPHSTELLERLRAEVERLERELAEVELRGGGDAAFRGHESALRRQLEVRRRELEAERRRRPKKKSQVANLALLLSLIVGLIFGAGWAKARYQWRSEPPVRVQTYEGRPTAVPKPQAPIWDDFDDPVVGGSSYEPNTRVTCDFFESQPGQYVLHCGTRPSDEELSCRSMPGQ